MQYKPRGLLSFLDEWKYCDTKRTYDEAHDLIQSEIARDKRSEEVEHGNKIKKVWVVK